MGASGEAVCGEVRSVAQAGGQIDISVKTHGTLSAAFRRLEPFLPLWINC